MSDHRTIPGYRGLWFTLGQFSAYGDKYSGGLGTYTANHVPMAVHAPQVGKTFFVYGGTPEAGQRHLLCMAGCYDHATHRVTRPTVVYDKQGVDDPHDNPAINLAPDGHLWVLVSGRGRSRPGLKFRSRQPYSIAGFERIEESEMTYPQLHLPDGGGMFLLLTQYTAGRELYWQTSPTGHAWSAVRKLAGFGGHYQVSAAAGGRIGTAFMYHPGGDVDRRTNLYYLQTPDRGQTWQTAAGEKVATPLETVHNPALVIDYQSQGLNVYIHDLNFDTLGNPIVLYLTSRGAEPGPANGPHTWRVTRWTGAVWETHDVAVSDHCYDTGCLHVEGDTWRIIGPTELGPQRFGTGGEMAVWTSTDAGRRWTRQRIVTHHSPYNHSYARRPLHAADPFYAFWADGHASELSPSRLYFTDRHGENVWQLPETMDGETATPVRMAT